MHKVYYSQHIIKCVPEIVSLQEIRVHSLANTGRTYVEFLKESGVSDCGSVLLYGLPELLLSRVAIHRTYLEPAVCNHTPHSQCINHHSVHCRVVNIAILYWYWQVLPILFSVLPEYCNTFYPRDAMLARVIVIATCHVCLSVRLSRAGIVSKRRKLAA